MKKSFILLTLFLFFSCQSGGHWTAKELKEWYNKNSFGKPLYYQGSDKNFHYFICRPIDNWVPVKVNRAEIELEKEIEKKSSGDFLVIT